MGSIYNIIFKHPVALKFHLWSMGKITQYPLDKRMGGPQSRTGHCGVVKFLAPAGNQIQGLQPVAHNYNKYAVPALTRAESKVFSIYKYAAAVELLLLKFGVTCSISPRNWIIIL
jgi:hypothetical protein